MLVKKMKTKNKNNTSSLEIQSSEFKKSKGLLSASLEEKPTLVKNAYTKTNIKKTS